MQISASQEAIVVLPFKGDSHTLVVSMGLVLLTATFDTLAWAGGQYDPDEGPAKARIPLGNAEVWVIVC